MSHLLNMDLAREMLERKESHVGQKVEPRRLRMHVLEGIKRLLDEKEASLLELHESEKTRMFIKGQRQAQDAMRKALGITGRRVQITDEDDQNDWQRVALIDEE